MLATIKKIIRKIIPFAFLDPEGDKGIEKRGHRDYIGGFWEEIGQLQFDFLKSRGLKPDSYLVDIACGSLRLGVKAIPYLDKSHYLGVEKEETLVKAGLEKELGKELEEEKQPNIIISNSFEFEKLNQKANFAMAQSLFTHLPPDLINTCFANLHSHFEDGGLFYATYFLSVKKVSNPEVSHDHGHFAYTKEEILAFGSDHGFEPNFIGDWNHPRQQIIVEYKKV